MATARKDWLTQCGVAVKKRQTDTDRSNLLKWWATNRKSEWKRKGVPLGAPPRVCLCVVLQAVSINTNMMTLCLHGRVTNHFIFLGLHWVALTQLRNTSQATCFMFMVYLWLNRDKQRSPQLGCDLRVVGSRRRQDGRTSGCSKMKFPLNLWLITQGAPRVCLFEWVLKENKLESISILTKYTGNAVL